MRKHLFLLASVVVMLFVPMFSNAQTIYFTDGFEDGLNAGWTQEYFDKVRGKWVTETPDISQPWKTESGADLQHPNGAVVGTGRAYFRQEATADRNVQTTGYRTRLVTPYLDLSAGYQPILRFYHAQAKWTADFDTLRVFYRQGKGTQWELLTEFTSPIQKWKFEEMDLPRTGPDYQIAFEANENMGRGIVLDSVIVRTKPQITTPHDMSYYDMRDNGINLTWEASKDADSFRVVVAEIDLDLNVNPLNIDSTQYMVLDTIISSEFAQDVRLENLAGGRTYYMQVQSIGEFENSVWSETFSFRMKPVVNITREQGYYESFYLPYKSNKIPDMQLETWTWGGDWEPVIPLWVGKEYFDVYSPDASEAVAFVGQKTSSSGVITYSIGRGQTSYIISPEISGKDIENFSMSMCHVTFWGTTYTYQHNRAKAIIVGVASDPTDPTTFVPVDTCEVWGYKQFTFFDVDLSSYTGNGRYVAFVSNFQDQDNWFALDDVTIELKPEIAMVKASEISVIPTTNAAQLSWPAVEGATGYKVKYMPLEEKGMSVPLTEKGMAGALTVQTVSDSITLSNLTVRTKYVYSVQAVGANSLGAWSQPREFYTSAEMSIPKLYEFEDGEGRYSREGTANEYFPSDWCVFTNDADAPYLYTSYYRSGSRCLYLVKDQYNDAWTVAPMIENVKEVELVLYARLSSTSYRGSNIVIGVMDDPSDLKTFTPVATFAPADVVYERFYANFLNYNGTGKYVALLWGESGVSKNGICVDDLTFRPLDNCVPPVMEIDQLTDSSGVLNWTRMEETDRYYIKVSATALTEEQIPTATGNQLLWEFEGYDSTTLSLSGLDYSTTYFVYASARCSDTQQSEWTGISFKTTCPERMKLPYSTGFEKEATSTIPNCWIKPTWSTTTSTYPYVSSSTSARTGSQYLYMYSTTTYGSTIALPQLDADLENVKVRFWAYYSTGGYKFFTGIMGNPDDPADFYPVDTFETVASTWILCESMFKAEDLKHGNYIAISNFTGSTGYVYIDDVEIVNVVNAAPFNYKKVDGDADWFEVKWDGKTTDKWQVVISKSYYPLSDTMYVNPADSIPAKDILVNTETTANNYKISSGLEPLTWYYIYAKSTAGTEWSMDSIQTDCNTWNPRVKQVQGFETNSKGENIRTVSYSLGSTATYGNYYMNAIIPECWTVGNIKWGTDLSKATSYTYRGYFPFIVTDGLNSSANPTAYAEKAAASNQYSSDGVNSLKIYGSYSSTASSNYAPAWAAMNKLDCSDEDLKSLILTFDYAMTTTSSYAVIVGIMDDPTDLSTFTVLDSIGPGIGTGSHKHKSAEISLDQYEGTGRYIAFRTPYGKTTTFYLDNVSVSLATCPNPNPSMSQVTDNSAVLASGLRVDNGWKYIITDSLYQSDNLDKGQMPDAAHIVAQGSLVGEYGDAAPKMTRVNGLQGNTEYYAYVTTLCDNDEISAWKMVSFTTLCDPVDADTWVGDFANDTTVSGYKPECWTVGSLTAGATGTYIPYVVSTTRAAEMADPTTAKTYNKTTGAVTGAKVLCMYAYSTTSVGCYAISPAIKPAAGKTLQNYQIVFKGYGTSAQSGTTTTTAYAHNLRVGMTSDPSDLSKVTILDTVFLPTEGKQAIVELDSYQGDGQYIVFLLEKEEPNYSRAYIYDIHMEPIPACKIPSGLKLDSTTENSASIYWKGNSSKYNVALSKKLYTEAEKEAGYLTNDSVIAADGILFKTVTEPAINFDGLEPSTGYYAYVQGICGETDTTVWAYGALSFKTECIAEQPIPLKENFEKYETSVTAPDCWDWADYMGTGYPKVMNPTSGAVSGHQYELWSTGTTHRTVVILPKVVGNLSDYIFSMDARSYGTTTASVVYVGTMKDIADSTTYAPLDTFYMDGGNEFTHIEMDLSKYNLVYDRIAITSGLGATLEKASDIYIDNIRLGLPITCFAPTSVTVVPGLTSAEVSFVPTDSLPGTWEVQVTKAGGEPKTYLADTTFYNITGLEPSTSYSVAVRKSCNGDYSDYTDGVVFNTKWQIDTYKWSFSQNEQGTISVPNKPSAAVATYAMHPALIPTGSQATLDYSSNTTYLPYQVMNTTSLAYAEDKRDFVAGGDTARALRLYRYFSTSYAYGDSAAVILPTILNPQGKQLSMDLRFGYAYASNHSTATYQDVVNYSYPNAVLCIGTVDSLQSNLSTYQEITRVKAHPMTVTDTLRAASNYGWMHYVLPLDMNLTGKQLVLMVQCPTSGYVFVDNLAVEAVEGIATPVLTSVSAGDTYATLNWNGNANAYNIYVVDTTQAPVGKYIPYIQDAPAACVDTIKNVSGNSYKVTDLAAGGNTYAFYVEDAAKAGIAGALSNRQFATTVCPAIQVEGGYSYDFEPGANYVMGANPSKSTADGFTFQWPTSTTASDTVYKTPDCWTVGIDYSGYDPTSTTYKSYNPTLRSNSMTAAAASQYRYARNGYSCMQFYGTSTYKEVYAVMPLMAGFDMDTMEVNFWGRSTYEKVQGGTIYTVSYLKGTSYSTKLAVGTMTDPNDPSTFVALDTIEYDYTANDLTTSTVATSDPTGNNYWLNFTVPMKGATGQYIAFKQVGYGYFYMDDLKIQKRQTARRPKNLQVIEVGSTTAQLAWQGEEKAEGSKYIVQLSNSATNWTSAVEYETTQDSISLTGLEVAKQYFFRVKQVGSKYGDTEFAHYETFTTECEALNPNGYKTGFECKDTDPYMVLPGATGTNVNTMLQNQCWTYWNMGTTQTVSSTYFPYNIVNTASAGYSHSGNYALKINQYTTTAGATTYRHCVVSPRIDAEIGEAGKGFDTLQISFWACPTYHGLSGTNKDKISSASGTSYAKYIEIGTCTDPADLSTYTVLQGWTYEVEGDNLKTGVQADANNDYAFRKVTVKLNNATGPYVFIRPNVDRGDGKSFTYSTMYIDDFQFETLKNCPLPANMKTVDVTTKNAKLQWEADALKFDVQVSEDPTFTDDAKMLADTTVVDSNYFFVEGLEASMTYYYRVKSYCDEEGKDVSDWTPVANFKTPYAPLYDEEFTTSLGEWHMAYGYANKIFAGEAQLRDTTTSGTYNSWYRVQNQIISGYALRLQLGYAASATPSYPISSTYQAESYYQKYWLVGPSITIEKEGAQLAFEAALANYQSTNPITVHDHWNEGWDDQFMIIISEDDGKTWKRENATIWNNETTNDSADAHYKYGIGDYVLTSIPATPTQMSIDLSKYVGKTIRIALYGENTDQNAMNSIHVDKIHINYLTKYEQSMSLCQFEDVDDVLGFNVNGDTVAAGEMQLKRSVLSYKSGVNDSLFVLNVEYDEAPQYYYEITICQGTPFEYMGFNQHSAPGTYRMKLTSVVTGCDSIVNFTINHTEALRSQIDTTICNGDVFNFHGKLLTEAGTYIDTLQACELYGGCDSIVTLHLGIRQTNYMPVTAEIWHGEIYNWYEYAFTESIRKDTVFMNQFGCDSTIALNLTVKYPEIIYTYDTICNGESYEWQGKTFTRTGTYLDTVRTAGEPDVLYGLNLTVNMPTSALISKTILHGETYQWFDEILTETVVKDTVLTNAVGCDSTIKLNLTVLYADVEYVREAICEGDTMEWLGKKYSQTGTYLDTIREAGQADKPMALILTVNQHTAGVVNASILHGLEYEWFGEKLTESAQRTNVIPNVAGCDSTVTLNLTVSYAPMQYINDSICLGGTYVWLGKEYTEMGTYVDTVRAAGQADQPMTLILKVNYPTAYEYAAAICPGDTYLFGGRELTEAGTYLDTLANIYGCDSVVTLRLTVKQPMNEVHDVEICYGTSYLFGGKELDQTGTYYDTIIGANECQAIITLNLTVNEPLRGTFRAEFCGEGYIFQGVMYGEGRHEVWIKNEYGCDSIVTLYLTETDDVHDTLRVTMCPGETYKDENFIVNKPGTYYAESARPGGCTVYHVLYFDYYATESSVDTIISKADLPYTYKGLTYGTSTKPGIYVDTIRTTSEGECELVIYHTLRIRECVGVNDTINVTLCAGEVYRDENFNESKPGVYSVEGFDEEGCSMFHVLNLSNYPSEIHVDTIIYTADLPYTYLDLFYDVTTERGVYVDTIQTTGTGGCMLTIYHKLTVIQSQQGIESILEENGQNVMKVMYHDHLYIVRKDGWYSITGQKVENPLK